MFLTNSPRNLHCNCYFVKIIYLFKIKRIHLFQIFRAMELRHTKFLGWLTLSLKMTQDMEKENPTCIHIRQVEFCPKSLEFWVDKTCPIPSFKCTSSLQWGNNGNKKFKMKSLTRRQALKLNFKIDFLVVFTAWGNIWLFSFWMT